MYKPLPLLMYLDNCKIIEKGMDLKLRHSTALAGDAFLLTVVVYSCQVTWTRIDWGIRKAPKYHDKLPLLMMRCKISGVSMLSCGACSQHDYRARLQRKV